MNALFRLFRNPTVAEVRAKAVVDTELELETALQNLEYYAAMAAMLQRRLARLRAAPTAPAAPLPEITP